jgi:Transposase DDE domain
MLTQGSIAVPLVRLVETFCAVDIFCQAFVPHWQAYLIRNGTAPRGPKSGLCVSEIITLLLMLHGLQFKYLKSFYNGVLGEVLRRYFPAMPCYERLVTLQQSVLIPRLCFLYSLGHRTGIYYIDSTALAVCHNRRIGRHETFAGLAARGKTSMGWFFGFKFHLVFNHLNEIAAVKRTPRQCSRWRAGEATHARPHRQALR